MLKLGHFPFYVAIGILCFSIGWSATPRKMRIITLAPNLAEIIYAIGAGDDLVGVSAATDYPPQAAQLPVVADYHGVDIEKIISLKPDLVIGWNNTSSDSEMAQLHVLHIPTYTAQFDDMQDIIKAMSKIGTLTNHSEGAQKFVEQWKWRYRHIREHYAHRRRVKVFFQLSLHPLMTVNHRSFISAIMMDCGGMNIFNQAWGVSPQVSVESILKRDPDLILVSDDSQIFSESKLFWQLYPQLSAVKKGHIFFVNPDWVERPGPRILNGMEWVCRKIDQVRREAA